MNKILLVRKGHLGDVIMTEPIARYYKERGFKVYLATEYIHAKALLRNTYAGFIKFSDIDKVSNFFEKKVLLNYETSPYHNYIDGYARSAEIIVDNPFPIVNTLWSNIIGCEYILLAPNTSKWISSMRNWGSTNFSMLKLLIEERLKMKTVVLEDKYSFTEMLSLIRHCNIFIGNDSAPAIIAQCFKKNTFVIFGPTDPKKITFGNKTSVIVNKNIDCIGCKHISRHTKILCASPVCMTQLTADFVFNSIVKIVNT